MDVRWDAAAVALIVVIVPAIVDVMAVVKGHAQMIAVDIVPKNVEAHAVILVDMAALTHALVAVVGFVMVVAQRLALVHAGQVVLALVFYNGKIC